ncbi:hypothetical protein GCM10009780_65620 [Actinomadura alba]
MAQTMRAVTGKAPLQSLTQLSAATSNRVDPPSREGRSVEARQATVLQLVQRRADRICHIAARPVRYGMSLPGSTTTLRGACPL